MSRRLSEDRGRRKQFERAGRTAGLDKKFNMQGRIVQLVYDDKKVEKRNSADRGYWCIGAFRDGI
jgi:hypothetical protein